MHLDFDLECKVNEIVKTSKMKNKNLSHIREASIKKPCKDNSDFVYSYLTKMQVKFPFESYNKQAEKMSNTIVNPKAKHHHASKKEDAQQQFSLFRTTTSIVKLE